MAFMNVIVWLSAYVLGSVSFSYLIAKKVANIDIRQHGSGNAGATNTLRVLGKGPAVIVLLLDVFKGVAAVIIAFFATGGNESVMAVAGLLAVAGHNWPVFFNFKGGKGIATTLGVLASLSFWPALISGILAILAIVLTRYVSVGSLLLVTSIPIFMFLFGEPLAYTVIAIIIAVLGYIRHRKNLVNLIRGQERKIGKSQKKHNHQGGGNSFE